MSQLDGVTKEIDGNSYTIYMLSPLLSHDLLLDLVKMVGPALGPVLDKIYGDKTENGLLQQSLGDDFFSKATSMLCVGLDKKILRDVIASVTHVDGKPLKPVFDIHFRGRLDTMYKWMAFGIEVQWRKSLSVLLTAATQGAILPTG